ncbi:MAG: DNA mismatch endonuclease Vsr [Paracoccaceae bacterium]|nr:DNA mismatch endonuclease Vsr [Paracoccaceae bacterium]MDE2674859.1 DNA mismatch endonuclease Vsr [Paracoccaceae bacterium]
MAKIEARDTKPKLALRSAFHRKGLPYQLHCKELSGTPDLVFPLYNAVLFVHGYFWHGHDSHLFRRPYTRQNLWYKKITKNKLRDSEQQAILSISGWRIAVICDCSPKGKTKLVCTDVIETIYCWLNSFCKADLEVKV